MNYLSLYRYFELHFSLSAKYVFQCTCNIPVLPIRQFYILMKLNNIHWLSPEDKDKNITTMVVKKHFSFSKQQSEILNFYKFENHKDNKSGHDFGISWPSFEERTAAKSSLTILKKSFRC